MLCQSCRPPNVSRTHSHQEIAEIHMIRCGECIIQDVDAQLLRYSPLYRINSTFALTSPRRRASRHLSGSRHREPRASSLQAQVRPRRTAACGSLRPFQAHDDPRATTLPLPRGEHEKHRQPHTKSIRTFVCLGHDLPRERNIVVCAPREPEVVRRLLLPGCNVHHVRLDTDVLCDIGRS